MNKTGVGVLEQLIEMAMNGSGVRDTSWRLRISQNTVMAYLKKLNPPCVTPLPFESITEVDLVGEMEEQWSYGSKKSEPRWLWYVWSPHFKRLFAYALGR